MLTGKGLRKNTFAGIQAKRLILVFILSVISASSAAALMTFNDHTAFQSAIGANTSTTLTFDDVGANTPILSGSNFQGIDFAFTDGGGGAIDGQVATGFDTTSGDNYLGFNDPVSNAFLSGDSIAMNFGQTIHAIGMYFIASPGDVLFSDDAILSAGNGSALLDLTSINTLPDGGEVFFLGLIDTDGFSSANLSTVCCGFFEFNLDDIQFSSFATQPPTGTGIPEPGTLSLFGLVLCALLRKRKR